MVVWSESVEEGGHVVEVYTVDPELDDSVVKVWFSPENKTSILVINLGV